MQFALIDNKRIKAGPQLQGICCCCSKPVIAKCGTRKIWHWAHKSKKNCDNWWEPETEWHRIWKNKYLSDWQEMSLLDKRTGEKHIADIRTVHNLVIEFQHSHIDPQERSSREKFYKNMVWIVDGTRLKRDYPRFLKEWRPDGISEVRQTDNVGIFEIWFPEFCFPESWLKSSVPVVFDFRGDGSLEDLYGLRKPLYCLFPQVGRHARVAEISHKAFVTTTTNGEWSSRVQEFISNFRKQDEIKRRLEQQQTMSRTVSFKQFGGPLNRFIYKSRRRRF
jgi:competence protein CoiA